MRADSSDLLDDAKARKYTRISRFAVFDWL